MNRFLQLSASDVPTLPDTHPVVTDFVNWLQHVVSRPVKTYQRTKRLLHSLRQRARVQSSSLNNLGEVADIAFNHGLNLGTIHAIQALTQPNRLALIDDQRSLTFEQANEEINRINGMLLEQFEVGSDEPVMIMMENRSEYVLTWFALLRIGRPVVHANYHQTADELLYQIKHSGARVLFVSETAYPAARDAQNQLDEDVDLVAVDPVDSDPDTHDYHRRLEETAADFPRDNGGSAGPGQNIVYTSGTTGRPKGTVRDMSADNRTDEIFALFDRLSMKQSDRHLMVAPLYHSGGQLFTILQSVLGSSLYLRPQFDAEDTLRSLDRWNINSIFMVPTMIRRVLNLPEPLHEEHPARSLKAVVSTAAPFPHSLRKRAIDRFGADAVHDSYGATELGTITHINGHEMLERPHSVGQALPGHELRILDEDGESLPPGEVGTIYVRNDFTIQGYLDNEQATEDIRRGEWMTVEDLGYLDEDGYLYLTGRSRDMVISGGVNIYPVEVEEVLQAHPTVKEAAVFGVPDEQWGEKLVAAVVPGDGTFDLEALKSHCGERLSGEKIPKEWKRMETLPRTRTGKILKRSLQEKFQEDSSDRTEHA